MSNFGHGSIGTREQSFTQLLPLRTVGYPPHLLAELAKTMAGEPDSVKDFADTEENLWVPAGYTYLGQFIDHDLTFDSTSSLNPSDAGGTERAPTNLRTPRFDLDSLYGDGPDAQPFMYGEDGASLLFKESCENQTQTQYDQAHQDLLRSPNGRAIIGDKRNDENSIVCQIHLVLIQFHNSVVKKLSQDDPTLKGTALFTQARNQVRWAYQKLVIEDFLPRIVKAEVLADLQKAKTKQARQNLYALFTEDKRSNLPREFVVAAYRFGHSGVRFGYRLNQETRLSIFEPSQNPANADSLLGFDPLPKSHVIDDWGRFFSTTPPSPIPCELKPVATKEEDDTVPNPAVRLQFAYKLDPTLVDPLTVLPPSVAGDAGQEAKVAIGPYDTLPDPQGRPSLALLNLLRGNAYKVKSGQAIARTLKEKGFREGQDKGYAPVEPLAAKYLVTRQVVENSDGKLSKFVPFTAELKTLETDTPLWFYILAEAQASMIDALGVAPNDEFETAKLFEFSVAQTQLGWVGGRIVAEVFYGLIDSDKESYVNLAPEDWKPIWTDEASACSQAIFANLIKFAGLKITSGS